MIQPPLRDDTAAEPQHDLTWAISNMVVAGIEVCKSPGSRYGKAREHLASIGMPVGPNDLLIAATALAHGCTLVTHNTQEFSRVPGLLLEDWQLP
jgi:predicted nucleic acid-binding protein